MINEKIKIPYGHSFMTLFARKYRIKAVLEPNNPVLTKITETEIIQKALENPVDSDRLSSLTANANRVLIITSDHTRPLPSSITLPLLLAEVRKFNPDVQIKIIIATGFHRPSSKKEMIDKFGRSLYENEDFIIHDCHDKNHLINSGTLPSGNKLWVNDLVEWSDFIVAEGYIEPHFFAGFSGGGKSVLPGISGADTVLANHNAALIANPASRTGNLEDNPLQQDIIYANNACGLKFILNVTLDSNKKINNAFAGDPYKAHRAGCSWLLNKAVIPQIMADIVITSNAGYPLDQNIYQAVKGMTAAESCVRPGGVIIIVASCEDGHGGEAFYRWFSEAGSIQEINAKIMSRSAEDTLPDQWEAQILARVLEKNMVILVSRHCSPDIIRNMKLHPAKNLEQAIELALSITGRNSEIVVIPDGVSVVVKKEATTNYGFIPRSMQ